MSHKDKGIWKAAGLLLLAVALICFGLWCDEWRMERLAKVLQRNGVGAPAATEGK